MYDESDERVDWTEDKLEQHESDQDRLRGAGERRRRETRVESERLVQCAVVDEDGKDDKGEKELRLRDQEEFGRVSWVSVGSAMCGVTHCSTNVRARGLLLAWSAGQTADSPKTASTSDGELFSMSVS